MDWGFGVVGRAVVVGRVVDRVNTLRAFPKGWERSMHTFWRTLRRSKTRKKYFMEDIVRDTEAQVKAFLASKPSSVEEEQFRAKKRKQLFKSQQILSASIDAYSSAALSDFAKMESIAESAVENATAFLPTGLESLRDGMDSTFQNAKWIALTQSDPNEYALSLHRFLFQVENILYKSRHVLIREGFRPIKRLKSFASRIGKALKKISE